MSGAFAVTQLLVELRAEGFAVGVDDHLRIGRLLGARALWPDDELRDALACVLVRDPSEQETFERVFARVLGREGSDRGADARDARAVEAPAVAPRPVGSVPRPPRRRGARAWVAALACAVTLAGGGLVWRAMRAPRPDEPGNAAETSRSPAAPTERPPCPPTVSRTEAHPGRRGPPYALAAGGALLAGACAAVAGGRRRSRQRFLPGPWDYHPRVPPALQTPAFRPEDIERAALALTFQPEGEHAHALDVERTVHRTVAAGGYPHLAFAPPPPSPEYAVLLDAGAAAAPWRPLFDELFTRLRLAGVRIHGYEFSGDPRVCRVAGARETERSLRAVAEESDAVVIVGEAAGQVPNIAEPAWVDAVADVPRAVWLNPLPPSRWGQSARRVARRVPMFFATIDALGYLREGDEPPEEPASRRYAPVIELEPDSAVALEELAQHLGDAMAALEIAAVLPHPDASLAAWLATRVGVQLTEGDRLRLLTLPWFATGRWPPGLPFRLLTALRARGESLERWARAEFVGLLGRESPPPESLASLRWELEQLVQAELLGDPHAPRELRRLAHTPVADDLDARLTLLHVRHAADADLVRGGALGSAALVAGLAWAASVPGAATVVTTTAGDCAVPPVTPPAERREEPAVSYATSAPEATEASARGSNVGALGPRPGHAGAIARERVVRAGDAGFPAARGERASLVPPPETGPVDAGTPGAEATAAGGRVLVVDRQIQLSGDVRYARVVFRPGGAIVVPAGGGHWLTLHADEVVSEGGAIMVLGEGEDGGDGVAGRPCNEGMCPTWATDDPAEFARAQRACQAPGSADRGGRGGAGQPGGRGAHVRIVARRVDAVICRVAGGRGGRGGEGGPGRTIQLREEAGTTNFQCPQGANGEDGADGPNGDCAVERQ